MIIKTDVLFLVQERLAIICMVLVNILALKEVFFVRLPFYCIFELISLF